MEDKKLDFKSIIGFVLISVVLMWMMYSNAPTKEEQEAKAKQEQVEKAVKSGVAIFFKCLKGLTFAEYFINKGRVMKKWMANASVTVNIYKPILDAKLPRSS